MTQPLTLEERQELLSQLHMFRKEVLENALRGTTHFEPKEFKLLLAKIDAKIDFVKRGA